MSPLSEGLIFFIILLATIAIIYFAGKYLISLIVSGITKFIDAIAGN
ncbi:hypothetical protein HOF65_04525 [bacterium]|jgi:hypothetical protein|nr:hypothetical protein [bacterium]MBT4632999.1 hypothetical protein [bacterium]MBT5492054.1 hypothetical protein [bacterium]MBT6778813.1 hypothetical protein [bacterium]